MKIIKGIQRGEGWESLFSEAYLGPRLCNQTDQSCTEYPGTLQAFSTAEKREEVAKLRQGRDAGTACRALCVWCFGYTPTARGTSEGPVQENDSSKDVFWNNNSVSSRVDRLDAENPPIALLRWPRSNRKRAGMGAAGLGTRGSTQGAYGAELPGRAGYRDSVGPGLRSGSEAQTDENASHRDGELGERSTLRK